MIEGHESIRAHLRRLISKNAIPHAFLFSGVSGIGKALVAKEFAQNLLSDNSSHAALKIASGNHPDLHIYYPEGKINLYSIETIRTLSQETSLQPNESKWKIFILNDAEKMLPAAANALLKTLEEPTSSTIIILISAHPDSLLPTILSRCYKIAFAPLSDKQVEKILLESKKNPQEAKQIAAHCLGSLTQAKILMEQNHYKDSIFHFLSQNQASYLSIQKTVQELDAYLKKDLADFEKAVKKENRSDLDIDHLIHAKQMEISQFLMETILDWYRQKAPASFEKVYHYICETEFSLQRSLKFSSCFEALFLKISNKM